jgi:hypothetical protein
MKPFLFPFLLIYLRIILMGIFKNKLLIKKYLVRAGLLLASFFLVMLPWGLRNYSVYKKVVLFTPSVFYPGYKTFTSFNSLLRAWGGSVPAWDGNCAFIISGYFNNDDPENKGCDFELPGYVFTPDYSREDIAAMRSDLKKFMLKPDDAADEKLSERIDGYTESFRKNKPLYFYLLVPLKMLNISQLQSGSYYIMKKSFFSLIIKIIQSLIYWIPVFAGMAGLVLLVKRSRKTAYLFLGIFISLLGLMCFYFRICEWRYFIYFHPMFILLTGYYINEISFARKYIMLNSGSVYSR